MAKTFDMNIQVPLVQERAAVGLAVGAPVGTAVGARVGNEVGVLDRAVGDVVGKAVGKAVGALVPAHEMCLTMSMVFLRIKSSPVFVFVSVSKYACGREHG